MSIRGKIAMGVELARAFVEGAGKVEREAKESAPAVSEDEAFSVRQAHREVAEEILARKQAIADARFNGKRQSMEELLAESMADSDYSDCPDHFDWKWCDKAGDFIKAEPRKVEFK